MHEPTSFPFDDDNLSNSGHGIFRDNFPEIRRYAWPYRPKSIPESRYVDRYRFEIVQLVLRERPASVHMHSLTAQIEQDTHLSPKGLNDGET